MIKEQFCTYCGESMGIFNHSKRFDGPLSCGVQECNRDASRDERDAYEERQERAREDEYDRY